MQPNVTFGGKKLMVPKRERYLHYVEDGPNMILDTSTDASHRIMPYHLTT